jgi:hypothetical protein
MSTAQLTSPTESPAPSLDNGPAGVDPSARVSFRQPVSADGFIDAAWWPRSRDLTVELPALLNGLWAAGREITSVTYNLSVWDPAPRRMIVQGRKVRLGGFATSDPSTVRLVDAWERERIDVLVIAPGTEPALAERILQLAAEPGSQLRADEILTRAGAAAGPTAESSVPA